VAVYAQHSPSPRPQAAVRLAARSFLRSSHAYMLVGMMMPSSPDWSDAFHGTQLAALIPFWLWAHSAALSFLVELVIPDESSRVCTARRPELAPFVSSFQPVASNFGRQPHFFFSFQLVAPNVARPPRPPRHPLRRPAPPLSRVRLHTPSPAAKLDVRPVAKLRALP
jgi:hypothetical protein